MCFLDGVGWGARSRTVRTVACLPKKKKTFSARTAHLMQRRVVPTVVCIFRTRPAVLLVAGGTILGSEIPGTASRTDAKGLHVVVGW